MKIQKRFISRYKDKDYYRFVVSIPKYILDEAGLVGGEIVDIKAEKGKIILIKK